VSKLPTDYMSMSVSSTHQHYVRYRKGPCRIHVLFIIINQAKNKTILVTNLSALGRLHGDSNTQYAHNT